MLNKRTRDTNKSKGPWGMKNFNVEYRKLGQKMHRHRFVSAPTSKGAKKQFLSMMEKEKTGVEIFSIQEAEWNE